MTYEEGYTVLGEIVDVTTMKLINGQGPAVSIAGMMVCERHFGELLNV